MLKGLPGSGKTTWAKEQVKNSGGKIKRVNKDELREMVDAGVYNKSNEKEILNIQWTTVVFWLDSGFDVIVDNTNFHPKHQKKAQDIIDNLNESITVTDNQNKQFDLEIKLFDTPLEECIRRDSLRPNPVGKNVIMQMYNQYLRPEPPKYNPDLPDCIIVDIDGTLSLNNGRNPFDETSVINDLPNRPVINILNPFIRHKDSAVMVYIFSGRTEGCREDTEKWLSKYISYDILKMRGVGDNRSDDIIKRELYEEYIKEKYNVLFVIDDRMRVCRLWYSLGLFVFNVNQGLIEF